MYSEKKGILLHGQLCIRNLSIYVLLLYILSNKAMMLLDKASPCPVAFPLYRAALSLFLHQYKCHQQTLEGPEKKV